MRSRRQWIHCLIVLRLIEAGRRQFGAAHLQRIHGNEYDDDAKDNDAGECFVVVVDRRPLVACIANFGRFVGTVGAIVPAVAQERGRNAHFIDGTLEVLCALAAIGFVVAVGAMRGAIAHQTPVDAFARLAPKLFRPTRRTADLIGFIWTVILTIATPRHGNTVFVEIRHTAADRR